MKKIKEISKIMVICLAALGFVFTSCNKTTTALKVTKDKVSVAVGGKESIVIRGGSTPYTVTSQDAKVATATLNRNKITIIGVAEGSTTVSVTDKNKKSITITVTVGNATSGLTFDKRSVSVAVGREESVTVSGGTAPYTATVKDAANATVTVKDKTITIKGVKAGNTIVTVTDKNKNSGSISVIVK